MKKSLIALLLILCMVFSMSVSSFAKDEETPAEPQYLELSSGKGFKPAWWCNEESHVIGYYAVAFTTPSNFTSVEFVLYCGSKAPVKISLFRYEDSIDDSIFGTPIWTEIQTISGDHTGPGGLPFVSCDFGRVIGAGRYVLMFEYGEEEMQRNGYFVVGAAAPSDNEDLDIEFDMQGFGSSVGEDPDATFAGRLVLTDADADPDPTPETTEEPTEAPVTEAPTEAPATEAPYAPTAPLTEEPASGGCGSLIGGSAAILAVMAAAAFIFRKRK